jgi:hypothetical protein
MSERSTQISSQPHSWKLVYRILSPNEIRPEEETPPMSLEACRQEARLLRDCIWLDSVLLYLKMVNINNDNDSYTFDIKY